MNSQDFSSFVPWGEFLEKGPESCASCAALADCRYDLGQLWRLHRWHGVRPPGSTVPVPFPSYPPAGVAPWAPRFALLYVHPSKGLTVYDLPDSLRRRALRRARR